MIPLKDMATSHFKAWVNCHRRHKLFPTIIREVFSKIPAHDRPPRNFIVSLVSQEAEYLFKFDYFLDVVQEFWELAFPVMRHLIARLRESERSLKSLTDNHEKLKNSANNSQSQCKNCGSNSTSE